MRTNVTYSDRKLTELILYIGDRCGLDPHYGALKLNKILFYADFAAFRSLGQPITGAEYRKYPHGPAPAVMKLVKHQMEERKDAIEYHRFLSAGAGDERVTEKRLLPRRAPDMTQFTVQEVAIVENVIEWLRPMTGGEVSQLSHSHPGWRLAGMEEKIPYSAAFLSPESQEPLSAKDLKRAERVAERFTAPRTSR